MKKPLTTIIIGTLFLSLFLVITPNVTAEASTADSWPMRGHDLAHTGYSTSTAPIINQPQWSYTTGSYVWSCPAVADGKVYVGSFDSKVYCLNAASGAFIWSYTTGSIVYSSPAVADGKVYVGSLDSKVYCLNAASGAFVWSYTTGSIVYSSPAVADGKVYVGSLDYKVYCLNAATGAFVWSYTTGSQVVSSPAVADGKVYVGSNDGKIYCFGPDDWPMFHHDAKHIGYSTSTAPNTNQLLWSYTTGSYVSSSPAVADGKVYVGSYDNKVYCLNGATGALVWSYTTGSQVRSSPAVSDGKIYVGSLDSKVYCLNAATGAFVWSYTTGDYVDPSPAVADGKVYVGSWDGKAYCLNAATGAFVWSYITGSSVASSPAVADGKVYVGSLDSKVYCLNGATGAFVWSYITGSMVDSSPAVADGKVYVGSQDGKVYCFGLPNICDFDGLFTFNNVRMIYPSAQTPKPLGCVAAMVSDWLSSAFIYTKLETVVEGMDTNSAYVNQASGKPLGAERAGIVSFGGPVVNPVVAYAESASTPTADRAPLKFYANAGTFYFQHKNGTSITGANLPSSVINNNMDMFIIESYRDTDGRYIMLCYGFGWQGTYAAGKYFDTEIYPNIASYPYSWTIVKWEDTNANGFVNTIPDGDAYTIIATG